MESIIKPKTMKYQYIKSIIVNRLSIWVTLCMLLPMTMLAQEAEEEIEIHSLKMIARSDGSKISLRWAPTTPYAWQETTQGGYILRRFTLQRDDQLLPFEERSVPVLLSQAPILPLQTQEEWAPLMKQDEYAAIGAQAIFGNSFDVEMGADAASGLINTAQEQTNRFGFGLFAADHSFEAATAMGLAFVDEDINPNEVYLYQVIPSQPSFPAIDTGYVMIGANEVFDLPKVRDVSADFGDGQATISWDKKVFELFYVSYQVERSADGQNWETLTENPFLSPGPSIRGNQYAFMVDSLPQNNTPFFYRVKGRTPFGEMGPPSDPVQGMGQDPLPDFFPTITSVLPNEQGGLNVSWEFNESDNAHIRGFQLLRGPSDQGPFNTLNEDELLPPERRFFMDENPLSNNYYMVVAIDSLGREMASFSALTQLDDEIPPASPVNLRGTILKNGVLVVSWDENEESDLLGYRVYVSNHPENEFSQLTSDVISKNFLIDTVSLNTLTQNIFVKAVALDYKHNRSEWSEIVMLSRPDTLPPSAPVIKDVRATTEGISLEWVNSSSTDVASHELFRRGGPEAEWELLQQIAFQDAQEVETYVDTTSKAGIICEYKVVAIDHGGLQISSKEINGQRIDDFVKSEVPVVKAVVDRRSKQIKLDWKYAKDEDVKLFVIYRAAGDSVAIQRHSGQKPQIALSKEGNKNRPSTYSFTDSSLRMNTNYMYRIRAIYEDGGESPLSDPVTVNF